MLILMLMVVVGVMLLFKAFDNSSLLDLIVGYTLFFVGTGSILLKAFGG